MSGIIDQFRNPTPTAVGESREDIGPEGLHALERPVAMLDLVLRDGTHAAFPYATLIKAVLDPQRGIVLSFSADEVVISGGKLDSLFKAIIQHRIRSVSITAERRGIGPGNTVRTPDEPVIAGIRVADPGEATSGSR